MPNRALSELRSIRDLGQPVPTWPRAFQHLIRSQNGAKHGSVFFILPDGKQPVLYQAYAFLGVHVCKHPAQLGSGGETHNPRAG